MTPFALLLALLAQAPLPAPPPAIAATLRQLRSQADKHRDTHGAAAPLTAAKHQLRDWVESRLAREGQGLDTRAFAETLHVALGGATLLCNDFRDECDTNFLGYVEDVRVNREGEFLIVVTSMGIRCGYDESAYVYAWDSRWRRVWEHEQNIYTEQGYLPQVIHDAQVSPSEGGRSRLLMVLGSQTTCSGAFKDIYARAWQIDDARRFVPALDWKAHANDAYPPIQGRLLTDGLLVQYAAGGMLSGDVHTAVRHFAIDKGRSTQVDPIASLPRDFVVEWLLAPWAESRTRSESASLEVWHERLRRTDGAGDFPGPTLQCTRGSDLWQVKTQMYERPVRYYRVRWREPLTFSMVETSDQPFPDCTVADSRGVTYPAVLHGDLR